MSWFRLDDKGHFNAKVLKAGNEAYGAWVRAGQWSSDHGTGGYVPEDVAHCIAAPEVWERLIKPPYGHETGLLIRVNGGYQMAANKPAMWSVADKGSWSRSAYHAVTLRDGRFCRYCGVDCGEQITIDHVTPRCQGGGDDVANLVVACKACNSRKGGRTPNQAAMSLLPLPQGDR